MYILLNKFGGGGGEGGAKYVIILVGGGADKSLRGTLGGVGLGGWMGVGKLIVSSSA